MALLRRLMTWFNGPRRVIAAVVAGWVLLIVVASGDKPNSSSWIGLPDLSDVAVIVVLAAAAIGLVLMIVVVPMKQELPERPRLSVRARLIRAAIFLGLLLAIERGILDNLRQRDSDPASSDAVLELVDENEPEAPIESDPLNSADLLSLAIAAGVAAALWAWTRGRTHTEEPGVDVGIDEADLVPMVDRAIEALLNGKDPRTAVLAAYAVLERALATRGQERFPAETATEHLGRVLATLPIDPSPLVRLGSLYEIARFSDHPIDQAHQQRAVADLDRARDELAALV